MNQSWSTQVPVATFPRWLCLVHGQLAMSLRRVKRSYVNANVSVCLIFNNVEFYLKYYFLRPRNSLSKRYVSYKYVRKHLQGNIKSNFYNWIKLVGYSFSVSPRNKTTEFIQCHINFGETSQGRPNYVLEWVLHRDVLGTSPERQF